MSKVQIFIDGKPVIADTSQTILQVCREQGFEIPTLCYDDQLEPFTSCFLCVVEVEGARTFVPACGAKVYQGMKIHTRNEKIENARKMALELLLSNHYADCLGPCKLSCPAGVDVQGYLALAAMGKYREAIELIKNNNPLPTVCGRVCTRPCEMNCRRNYVDEPAAIDHVKRFIADIDLDSPDRYFPETKPDTGFKVAIVGAGPAGLSCAYYLRQEGHSVDIFDAKPKAGGMLRWGIPQYRLPEEILDKEIEGITKLGVNIHLNQALGRDFTLDSLFDKGYKAVFLGLGAQASSSMRVENENAEGVLSGIDFLEDVKMGKIKSLKGRVGVVGGGNTAMDAARTALRLGADEVHIIYRRTRKEMPANEIEIEEAEEEGIKFTFLTAPVKVTLDENQRADGLECVQMELGPPDESGRRRPIPVEGSNFKIELDWVIAAIGQKPDLEFAAADNKLVNVAKSKWGTLEVRPEIMETNIPGVFAGGDVVLGPATAVEAIADGRKAAQAIHKYLTGKRLDIVKKPFVSRRDNFKQLSPEDFSAIPKTQRAKMPVRDPEERKKDFNEIELGFNAEQAFNEAIRCLECGCQAFYDCDLQRHATEYEANQINFSGEYHDVPVDNSHPFIQIELNKCILCGRCVRICDEVMGIGVFGFVQRGFDAKVKPTLESPLAESACISCGQCVETCPTGAIIDKVDATKPGPWVLEQKQSICQYCSVGCSLTADILEDRVIKVSADGNARVNEFGNLCEKGRYGFRYVNDPNRLQQPMIRRNGALEPVSWEEAFKFTANKIRELKGSGDDWMVLGSPQTTNEENYLLQKFARTVLGTNQIGSLSDLSDLPENLRRASMSNANFDAIPQSDLLLVTNFDPMVSHPVLYVKLQKAIRKGQKLYMLADNSSRLARKGIGMEISPQLQAKFWAFVIANLKKSNKYDELLKRNPGLAKSDIFTKAEDISAGLTAADFSVSEKQLRMLFKDLVAADNPLLLMDETSASPELLHWLNSLAFVLSKEEMIISMPAHINSRGMKDMGISGRFLPGYQPADNPQVLQRISEMWDRPVAEGANLVAAEIPAKLESGNLRGVICWQQDPVGAGLPLAADFLAVADLFLTPTAEKADVVFPLLPFMEIDGSVTNAEGRVIRFAQALKPKAGIANWQIINELFCHLGYPQEFTVTEEVFEEITRVVPEYKKEIALFRNGYLPAAEPGGEKKFLKTSPQYLERWFQEMKENLKKGKTTGVFTG
ncbi:MAG: formate dehydrogenase subunit alpha [Calditrichia bacterium]